MSKNSPAYSHASNRAKLLEAIGFDTVTYRIDDDPEKEFHFPHPMMYDRATKAAMKELKDEDTEGIVRLLLDGVPDTESYNPGQFDRFLAEGGDLDDIGETQTLVNIASQQALRTGVPIGG